MERVHDIISAYGCYLLERGYYTPDEISKMNISQIQDKFFEAKIKEEIAGEMMTNDFDD